jgi:hypothetical protein
MSSVKRVSGDYTIQSIGASDTVNVNSPFVNITGNLTVTGNAVLVGNINADKIFNGTTSIEIPVTGGNANITVGGTSNVAVFTTTGEFITGVLSASGNIDGGNLRTAGQVSATGNVTSGNVTVTTGNIVLTQTSGATTNQMIRFQDANTAVTTLGANIGSIEWYTSDSTGAGARIAARIQAVYADTNGNANLQIQTGSSATPATRITVIGSSGNVGIANAAPLDTLAVTGTVYVSGNITSAANIAGGNVLTTNRNQSANIVVTGAISTPSWTTTGVGIRTVASTYTDSSTAISGTATTNHIHVLAQPTLAGTNATVTTTAASTLYIADAPAAGSNMTITNPYALYIAAGNTYSGGNIYSIANITGGNINSDAGISATGNITGANIVGVQNIYTTGNVNTANINVSTRMNGNGIGVENTIWQSVANTIVDGAGTANVGVLQFQALAGYSYKWEAYLPAIPAGATTTSFATYFDGGTCNYTLQTQTTATAAFAIATSNTSDSTGTTQAMTGTTLRTVRLQGTFYHSGNANVAVRAASTGADVVVQSGSYLSYTRIA